MVAYLLFVLGLVGVLAGAHLLVLGSSRLAASLGVPAVVIGMTVVGFGTSAPEIVVSGLASFRGESDTALGNVVGSNIANVGLVLGIAAAIYPHRPDATTLRREGPVMVAVSVVFLLVAFTGGYERWHGLVMLIALAVFLVVALRWSRDEPPEIVAEIERFEEETGLLTPTRPPQQVLYVLVGIAMLIVGGQALVTGAVDIADDFGIPQFVIASTLVAIGTSVPELATSVVAAFRKEADIAFGNIFNLLCVLGIASAIGTIPVEGIVQRVDMPVMVGFSVAAVVMARSGRWLARWEGMALFGAYVVYIVYLLAR